MLIQSALTLYTTAMIKLVLLTTGLSVMSKFPHKYCTLTMIVQLYNCTIIVNVQYLCGNLLITDRPVVNNTSFIIAVVYSVSAD